ncbi:thiol:disulfide interchange protein [Algicola sagamiensis]|uniref:thiol:disulfide interchange protein n=1 Tax=Algicola sagamiensis TaxID=163869 RepID=UPI00037A3258|nr:thiol:disulfide interchange protein [Algicola sagamiensis]
MQLRKIAFILPLLTFAIVSVYLYSALYSDPRAKESSLLNRTVPDFQLNDLMDPTRQYKVKDLKGEVTLLNIWGVWCTTCKAELGFLTKLKEELGLRIIGIYYPLDVDPDLDGPLDLAKLTNNVDKTLKAYGNPYQFNMLDIEHQLSFDLGVTGAPETFVIDKHGVVRAHHMGDINPRVWQIKLAALVQQLKEEE